jgi:hypothetical protein
VADLFDFILVMVSLVLAIGVTHLVHGVANLIRLRGDTRLEPLPLVWAASLFLVGAQYWWSLWDFRNVEWRYPHFLYLLIAPTLLHIAASLLVSTDAVERGASLQSEFERIRVPFMVVMAAFSVVVAFDGWILGVEPVWTDFRPIQMWVVALYAAGAAVAGTRTQHMVGGLVLVSYLVAGLFFRYMPGAYGS